MNSDQLKSNEAEVTDWIKIYISSGNKESWGKIFEKFKKNIFIQCCRIINNEEEAKDLTSDVFIKAIEKIHTYELNRPFLPWLYGIAKNLCIDHIRRKKRIQFTQLENAGDLKDDDDQVENEDSKNTAVKIKYAIDKLKRPQRICFSLFYIHQKSYNEIINLTGYSYNEVRSHIQNARRMFKLLMER